MKKFLRFFCISIAVLNATYSDAQCGAGYTSAQLNWDHVDYYWNSGGSAPYQSYVSDAMEMNQKFAIGPNYVTIALSSNNMVAPSTASPTYGSAENTTHTGEISGYTGADVQYNPSASGQTITLTFNSEAKNVSFTLYDVDGSQRIDFSAKNAALVAQTINVVTYASSILTINNNNATNAYIVASSTTAGTSSNTASATITVGGPVKTITITISNVGSDAVFWLSDINACVTGSFPTNYNQDAGTTNGVANNQPFTGPTQNQADYFIVTPDNQSVYMVDPATGDARLLFTDASQPYVNSFGYDPYHHILYYVTDFTSSPSGNKSLKKYDFNTGTISTVVANITTTLGIPTFDQGVESAAAAFYDGALYLGIEGGRYSSSSSTRTRETIIWRIDFDASLNPTGAYQVIANDAYLNASNTSVHDYGDFIIKNGVLYDYNTARNGTSYNQSKFQIYDLMTGSETNYNNPGTTEWNGQAGMTWAGQLYYFRNTTSGNSGVGTYDGTNVLGSIKNIAVVDGTGAWPGGNGDASENFRPKCDFGDAPATYDPNPVSPAVHERSDNIRLGTTWDNEIVKKGLSSTEDADDGLSYVPVLNPSAANYLTQVSVYNNSGADATVCAWLDYNGNGVFDASEGITATVPPSASNQLVWLYWPSAPTTLSMGSHTYLRIRVTSASAGMTTSMPTGFFEDGEVEDYQVEVNSYPLSVQTSDFTAKLTKANTTKLTWTSSDESDVAYYSIEKSTNNTDWSSVQFVSPQMKGGANNYEINDGNLSEGITYYRLKTFQKNNKVTISNIKQVDNKINKFSILVTPNPASSRAFVHINSNLTEEATLELINSLGEVVYKQNMKINPGTNSIELPVANFANGTYVVNLTTATKSLRKSLIVNK